MSRKACSPTTGGKSGEVTRALLREQWCATRDNRAMTTKPSARRTEAAPHVVRIIGGQWRRTRLPVADKPGLRPTPDRVRETLYNWLGQDLTGWRCVDAFAGTGALGFEAASRGATDVLLIEQDPSLAASLRALKERLQAETVRVQRGDGIAALRALAAGSVDLARLDPPFGANLFSPALDAAASADDVVILNQGKFVAAGSARQVMNAQNLEAAFGMPFEIIEHGGRIAILPA